MVNFPEFFQTWNFNRTSGRNMKTCRIQVIVSVKHFLKTWYIIIVIMNMYFIAVRYVIIFIVRIKDRILHKLNFICKYIFSYCPHFRMSHKCFVVKINDSANRQPNFLLPSDFYLLQTHFFLERICIILQYWVCSYYICIQFEYWWLKQN